MKPTTNQEQTPATCRLCSNGPIHCLGAIPDSDHFAGRVLAQPIYGGKLWICDNCQSMFRHPVSQASDYLNLYENGTADEWSADHDRQDFARIRGIIAQNVRSASILDVGCGAGDFLFALPARLSKYGIEPSQAAAAAARKRGVTILAPTLARLPRQSIFDVITMIDVIEHVTNPNHLLDEALPHLAPGGTLIVATGDAGNVAWRRIFRSRFWYSTFPEHITFPSLRYFHMWHKDKELQLPRAIQLKCRRIAFWRAALYFASQVLYLINPWLLNQIGRSVEWVLRKPHPRRLLFSPGGPGVFTDHHIVMIQRPPLE